MDRIKKSIGVLCVGTSDEICLRALWRQCVGNRAKAFKILSEHLAHYGIGNLTEFEFDCITGEMNDGIEVEWDS